MANQGALVFAGNRPRLRRASGQGLADIGHAPAPPRRCPPRSAVLAACQGNPALPSPTSGGDNQTGHGDGDGELIEVTFGKIPPHVTSIVFVCAAYLTKVNSTPRSE
ncbi:TerD family protein [Streptomyces lydicus]|uniref:TerD family protein n=1 Tax=Streptomyces lydicus TaxID=47763 RepID=UPI0037B70C62